jgi:tetratricopeptide (TPR) repeat protein
MTQITPIDYFFTQCRALWRYLLLIVVPVGQNLDPDFPLSHGILDHGSLFGLIGLLGLTVAAWVFRRRYPLAAFGWLSFLILIAPTSSFAPILDPVAERRLYFPFLGIVCILLEALRRLQWNQAAMSAAVAVLAVLSLATHFRSQLWASELALWRDTVEKSPGKYRPRFQLAHALYQQGQCDVALREYALASKLAKPDAQLLVDWAHAADCAGRPEDAVAHARKALELEQSAHLYAALGMFEAKRGHLDEAMAALDLAAAKDPGFAMTFVYRGNVYASRSDWSKAAADYRRALQIDPVNQGALHGLRLVREQGHQ